MSTQTRRKGSVGGNGARVLTAVAAAVTLLMVARPLRAADPCAAVKEYQETQQWEKEAKRKYDVLEPVERRPHGTVDEWREMIRNLKAQPGFLTVHEANNRMGANDRERKEIGPQVDILEREIPELNREIGRLKEARLGTDDEGKERELARQIDAAQKEMKAKQAKFVVLKPRLNELAQQYKNLKEVHKAGVLVNSLEEWSAFAGAEEEWKIASDDLKKAKSDYDAAVVAKNQVLAKAQAKYQEEQARIQRITASLQGATKDGAYYQKLSQMTLHAQSTLELLLITLTDYDCFPDVRSYMNTLKQKLRRLDVTREQIIAQAGAAKTAKPVTARPATAKPATAQSAQTFRLVSKKLGHAPEPGGDNNATIEGSMSETSFRFEMKGRPPSTARLSVTHTYSAGLGATLKPGDIIELTVTSASSKSDKDAPVIGSGASWQVEGSVTILEQTKTYAGMTSDGKFFPQSSAKTRFKVLTGGKIKITAVHGGHAWGSTDNGNPVEYIYESGAR